MKRLLAVAFCALVAVAAPASAQLPNLNPTPRPTAAPTAAPTAQPTARPTARPTPAPTPVPGEPSDPTPTPDSIGSLLAPEETAAPEASSQPQQSPAPLSELVGGVPRNFTVPILPRTPGRNTTKLVRILEQATEAGIPLEAALAQGMGRFPVAGIAYYSDDWQAPRFTPIFHLHEGLDIFADFGTPIKSPDRGVVTRITDGPVGGQSVYVKGQDSSEYYFAHLQSYAPGLSVGQAVEIGTIIGYVGDTGNARGGTPHLHFEVHRPGPIPPKPLVDRWLAEAEGAAAQWVSDRIAELLGERDLLRNDHQLADLLSVDRTQPGDTPEYSLLLALLDPVAGSVGVLPRVGLVPPAANGGGAGKLLDDLIAQRVQGTILTNFITGGAERHDAGGGG